MLNRVILMGRLVANPELKTTNADISVTSFRIAVDRSYVKAGEERQTDFFDIVAWRHKAEFVCRNFSKGSLIAIDGQLQSRQYQTKDGQNRTVIEVVAENVSFTGERREAAPNQTQTAQNQPPRNARQYEPQVQTMPFIVPPQYAQQPQYPQNVQGAAYDPRYAQGTLQPGGMPYTSDGDLPF